MWLLILSVSGALAISAFCSLMEATLLSLSPSQIASISARRRRIGSLWQHFKTNIERPIASILILNTAAHTIGASVAGAEFDRLFGSEWIWVFSLVFTFLMLQFTEILPKGVGVHYNRTIALWIAEPLALLIRVLHPVEALVRFINRPFREVRVEAVSPDPLDEIVALAGMARLSKLIGADQERIIKRGALLSGSKVRDVMRPRVDIDALDVDTPPDEVLGAVVMSGFSRVPVYEGDLDHIIGFIYNKDLLLNLHMRRPIRVRELLRPALLVPETLPVDTMLEMFRKERTQMAIILDEYGGTEGMITAEDILAELVGTLHEEHRRDRRPAMVRVDETSWLVDGAVSLAELLLTVGHPELHATLPHEVSTAGGLLQSLLDRVPAVGDRVLWAHFSMEVVAMEGRRVEQVLVRREEEVVESE